MHVPLAVIAVAGLIAFIGSGCVAFALCRAASVGDRWPWD
jgi:hypothetical protein